MKQAIERFALPTEWPGDADQCAQLIRAKGKELGWYCNPVRYARGVKRSTVRTVLFPVIRAFGEWVLACPQLEAIVTAVYYPSSGRVRHETVTTLQRLAQFITDDSGEQILSNLAITRTDVGRKDIGGRSMVVLLSEYFLW
jgi:hypothetical protein